MQDHYPESNARDTEFTTWSDFCVGDINPKHCPNGYLTNLGRYRGSDIDSCAEASSPEVTSGTIGE